MIRGVIFDLDGTLWNTEEAYLESYKKLADEFSFERANYETVKSCLGEKLDEIVRRLYPNCPNKEELAFLSVKYVAGYCSKKPMFYSNNLQNIFKELSQKYDVYIMSNCPRDFLNSFMEISKLTPYVQGTFSISEGSKKDHLKAITKNFTETVLFVGDSQYDYDEIENHKRIQFCYAKYGYINCKNYEYHIDNLDEIVTLVKKIERKERMIDCEDYQIYSCGDTNVTVINLENYSMFGFIEYNNRNEFVDVLKQIKADAKQKLIGPINGKTWYSYRLTLDNFDWKLYPDCMSNKEINDALEENGFEVFHTYSSTLAKLNQKLWTVAKRFKLPPEYTTSIIRGEDCYKYLPQIYEIATSVFDEADYYRDISFEDFKDIYMEGMRNINPVLITILKGETLCAFLFAFEDPEKRFYVSKTIGIRKEERNKVVLLKLLDVSFDFSVKEGYDTVLNHFQNDRTKVMESLSSGYELKKKTYGLFKYENK